MQNSSLTSPATSHQTLVIRNDDTAPKKLKRPGLLTALFRRNAPTFTPTIKTDTLVEHALRLALKTCNNQSKNSTSFQVAPNIASLRSAYSKNMGVKNPSGQEFEGTPFAGLPSLPEAYSCTFDKPQTMRPETQTLNSTSDSLNTSDDLIDSFPTHLRPAVTALASTLSLIPEDELAHMIEKWDWKSRKLIRMIANSAS